MAIFLSSILSDLTTRSISFLIDGCSRSTSPPTVEETLSNLQRLLLRAHVIVEEADERHISNQAMLRLLSQLRKYRGYHTLDTFRCRGGGGAYEENHVSPSFTPSIFSPVKRIRFSSDSSSSEQKQLRQVLGCLKGAIRDMSEFVVFLSGCPRLCRQPYSMYLLLDHCMFGRQIEMTIIMDFLLQEEAPIDGNTPGVLPIVGPGKVGKSTLIEHACNHERVRDHFSQIMCFRQCGTRDERTVATLNDCDVIKHRSRATGKERILVIIELIGDMDEDVWRKFYSDCKDHIAGGSKIIVASRSDKIARFGTTQALKVRLLTPEEYWYFFKVSTFGSMDTQDHPKLASIAMDLAHENEMHGSFFNAGIFSSMLKANFDAHFWSMVLAGVKKFKRVNPLLCREKWDDFLQGIEPINIRVNKTSSVYLVVLHDYETGFVQNKAENEGPQMSIRDLLFGGNNVRPRGRFEVVAWRSHIPPHYSYVWDCEVRRPQRMVSKPSSRRKIIQHIQS